jgi:hypothetical protein
MALPKRSTRMWCWACLPRAIIPTSTTARWISSIPVSGMG